MYLRIRRRRFAQLMISGAAASAIANLAGKAVGQVPSVEISSDQILGVRLSKPDTVSDVKTTPSISLVTANPVTGEQTTLVDIPSTNVTSRSVNNDARDSTTTSGNKTKSLATQPIERITAFTVSFDGKLVVSSVLSQQQGNFSRLLILDAKSGKLQTALELTGFTTKNATLESLVATKENYLGLVSLSGGITPFEFVGVEPTSGEIFPGAKLSLPDLFFAQRYSNLALAPDGTIYATNLGSQGSTVLIQIDLADRSVVTGKAKIKSVAVLRYNKEKLENDLLSLAISSKGEIYALAKPKRDGTNSLFTIDSKTGEMTFIREFAVDKIAFSPL
ncbi:hypothetical protein [Fischerella sp. JS2]|uniref:hypothetical protein n=1 Tax=Fischerella sp. JS2 TaxID=2597771 RepID=UPI0028EE2A7E|nr:hypothetical protein [Fischerella sp. JS2]